MSNLAVVYSKEMVNKGVSIQISSSRHFGIGFFWYPFGCFFSNTQKGIKRMGIKKAKFWVLKIWHFGARLFWYPFGFSKLKKSWKSKTTSGQKPKDSLWGPKDRNHYGFLAGTWEEERNTNYRVETLWGVNLVNFWPVTLRIIWGYFWPQKVIVHFSRLFFEPLREYTVKKLKLAIFKVIGGEKFECAKTDPVRFKWGFGERLLKDKFAFFRGL